MEKLATMDILINGEPCRATYHPCSDKRTHYCIAVLNDNNQPVSAHTLPKSWPYGSTGKIKTSGNTYEWAKG